MLRDPAENCPMIYKILTYALEPIFNKDVVRLIYRWRYCQ